eukprot:558048_1
MSTGSRKKKRKSKSVLDYLGTKYGKSNIVQQCLDDPFASTTTRSNHNTSKSPKKSKKRLSTKYSIYPNLTPDQPKKKRKVSEIQSLTSQSSSDIEILNTNKPIHHNGHNGHNNHHNHKHKRKTPYKQRKSPSKHRKSPSKPRQTYNLYANAIIPTQNGHISTDPSNGSIDGRDPIPFPREKDRSKLHPHDSLDTHSIRSLQSAISTKKNKDFDETVSNWSRMSRRSKSRSPPPKSKSPMSQLSSKMTESQDVLALSLRSKSKQQIAMREATQDAAQLSKRNKKKHNKEYSSLSNLFTNSNRNEKIKPYSRGNTGGKHRVKRRKSSAKHLFFAMRGSMLNDLPCPKLSRNGEILTTDLDKKGYQDLMEISTEEKKKQITKHLSADLADFVEETDRMEITKLKPKKNEKVEIDLTNEEDEDKSMDLVILNTDEDDDDVIVLNKSPFSLRKAREQSHKKWDAQIKDDLFRSQRFGQEFNAKDAKTRRICAYIKRYKKKKEDERKRKEEEERLRKEAQRKELEALEAAQAKEAALAQASVSNIRDLKLRELDDEDEELIEEVFDLSPNEVVGTHQGSNIEVRVRDLQTLEEGQWLNDEVMNFYMALLQDRNLKRIKDNPKHICVLFMNTFFFTKLSSNSYNYKAVKRWTKKAKLKKKGLCTMETIFELDKFIFPVHVNRIHWCCGCINFKHKKFEYYDSMNGSATEFFRIIRKYIEDEYKDKLKGDKTKYNLDLSEWSNDNHRDKYPQQQNGVDCGVFTSKCADWISDELYPDYSQQDMQYFRERIMVEIIRGRTLDYTSPAKTRRQTYNLYANAIIPTQNGHISTDPSNGSIDGRDPIPFPREKDRSKLHPHDSLDTHSIRSLQSAISTKKNKDFDETVSNW